ncbi:MAG: hypothetical protein QXF56_04480 [Candidatus Micrarchaeia archaeon]
MFFKIFKKSAYSDSFLLAIFFILLVVVKTIVSLAFPTPWIFADETIYDNTAKNILIGKFVSELKHAQLYPPGYPLFLSIAYLSANKDVVYHTMLLINAILSSSIIFPAYFILKKFVNKLEAIGFSIVVSCLPSSSIYSFVLMSENLFIPLFLFSCWFLIESASKKKPIFNILLWFSIFLLLLTRATGIAMLGGIVFAKVYFILKQSKGDRIPAVRNELASMASFILPLLLWFFYKLNYTTNQLVVFDYDNQAYINTIFNIFSNFDSFIIFINLAIHEIDYLIITTYFAFFIYALYSVLKNDKNKKTLRYEYLTLFSYITVSSFLSVLMATLHMHKNFVTGDIRYTLFVRYVDPLIAPIFILGVIGFDQLRKNKFPTVTIIVTYIAITALVVSTFPHVDHKFPSTFGINYVQKLSNLSLELFLIVLGFLTLALTLIAVKNNKTGMTILLLFLILLSIWLSIPLFNQQYKNSIDMENVNQIGRYLQKHSTDNTTVLMDANDFYANKRMWFLTRFWMQGNLVLYSIEKDSPLDKYDGNATYIISTRILPYKLVVSSNNGYKLYCIECSNEDKINEITRILNTTGEYSIDIGKDDWGIVWNFWDPENQKIRWTKNISGVKIIYPKDFGDMNITILSGGHRPPQNPANIEVFVNNCSVYSSQKTSGVFVFSFAVPQNCLNPAYQILTLKTNTWKPSDYGSKDARELGIQVDWIKIEISHNN